MPGESTLTHHGLRTPAVPSATGVLQAVGEAVSRLRYGVVQLTVHDGKVVQLDVTERQRFP